MTDKMNDRVVTEILAAHAGRLAEGKPGDKERYLSLFPQYRERIGPLLSLAERVKEAADPIEISGEFREILHHDLVTAAGWQPAQRSTRVSMSRLTEALDPELSRLLPQPPRKVALIGGAVLGSFLSLAGIVTYLLRSRSGSNSHRVSPI